MNFGKKLKSAGKKIIGDEDTTIDVLFDRRAREKREKKAKKQKKKDAKHKNK